MGTFSTRPRPTYMALCLLLLAVHAGFGANSGSIAGRVVDKTTGDPLPGANVTIQGTSIGGATDLDGKYVLRIVPAGTQSLRVTYVGYVTMTMSVTVDENATLSQDFRLAPQAIQGETVVVTGQSKGQMSAINQQLSSNSIINVVSADKMKELPDANIAESIGRLPGISLTRTAGEANGVVVRGLSPKFNEVTIEGIPMSSTNYFDRGIDLSLLSDDLVRSVEVSKTLRPDLDADALGGTINLTLKSADPGLHYNVLGLGAYNNLQSTYRNYKFAGSVSDRFLDDQVGVLAQGSIEQKQLPSDQFAGSYGSVVPISQSPLEFTIPTNSAQLTESNLNRHRYSASLILDYASDFLDIKIFNVYDQKRDSNKTRTFQSNFSSPGFQYNILVNETKTEQRTHSLVAMFKPWGTELPVSLSYTKGDQTVPSGMEFDFLQTGLPTLGPNALVFAQPLTLMGSEGVMDPSQSTLSNLYISNTNLRDESYDAKVDWRVPFTVSDFASGKLSVGGKYHAVSRTSTNTRMYYNVQYGGSKARRTTLIGAFPFLYGANNALEAGIPAGPFVDPAFTRKSILGYPIGPSFDINKLSYMMNTIYPAWSDLFYRDGVQSFNQNYFDDENTAAGYIMGEINIGSNLTIVPGARYQDEVTDISAYHIQLNSSNQGGLAGQAPALVASKRHTPDWYPSINIKYRATEGVQVLGAVFKSVSLPSYGEVNPLIEYNANQNFVLGNPLLRPSTAWNFDLGASVSSNDIGLVTVNFFYKEIDNLIYGMQGFLPFFPYQVTGAPADIWDRLPGPQSGYFDTSWAKANLGTKLIANIPMNDPSKAFLRGVEISWQTHLWYLPGVLSGIVLDFNASYMSSRQLYPSFQQVKVGGSIFNPIYNLVYQTVAGPLQNQPKAIYNATLGWDYSGFSSRFSLRYQQLTLNSFDTQYGLQDSYNDNVLLVDIALKQQIIGNLYVFANATNVNGHVDYSYYSHPAFGPIAAGQLPTSQQTYGWAVQAGLTFSY